MCPTKKAYTRNINALKEVVDCRNHDKQRLTSEEDIFHKVQTPSEDLVTEFFWIPVCYTNNVIFHSRNSNRSKMLAHVNLK